MGYESANERRMEDANVLDFVRAELLVDHLPDDFVGVHGRGMGEGLMGMEREGNRGK